MRSALSRPIIGIILIVLLLCVSVLVYLGFHKKTPVLVIVEVPLQATSSYKVIGTSVQGRIIESYTFGTGETHLLFVGGIHGGYEWNSVLLAYQFLDYLNQSTSIVPKNISITVIPSLNPDAVFAVTKKEGRFGVGDVSTNKVVRANARFNANGVDLNRNFDCNWKPKSTWQTKTVSAGTKVFSEPETSALRDLVLEYKPDAVVFWHSQANAVYASECNKGILPQTLDIMNAYAKASKYSAVKTFDSYAVTGDAEGWLASINIPAITVELSSHETIEWERNLAGIKALFDYYTPK